MPMVTDSATAAWAIFPGMTYRVSIEREGCGENHEFADLNRAREAFHASLKKEPKPLRVILTKWEDPYVAKILSVWREPIPA